MRTRSNAVIGGVALVVIIAGWLYTRPSETALSQNPAPVLVDEPAPGGESLWNFSEFPLKMSLSENPDEIEKTLGTAPSREKRTVENIHIQGQMDLVHELKYEDLQINIYETTGEGNSDGKKLFLESLIIKGNKYELREGIKIGMTKAEVLSKFGEPESASEDTITYTSGSEAGNTIRLHFKNDQLVEIDWYPYFG